MAVISRRRRAAKVVELANYTLKTEHLIVVVRHEDGERIESMWLNEKGEEGIELTREVVAVLISELEAIQQRIDELEGETSETQQTE